MTLFLLFSRECSSVGTEILGNERKTHRHCDDTRQTSPLPVIYDMSLYWHTIKYRCTGLFDEFTRLHTLLAAVFKVHDIYRHCICNETKEIG